MKIDEFVSDKVIVQELRPEYMSPCSQLTFEADIRIAKEKILERQKKESSSNAYKDLWKYELKDFVFLNLL